MSEVLENIKKNVEHLANSIGERNFTKLENLEKTAKYISSKLNDYGYNPYIEEFKVKDLSPITRILNFFSGIKYDISDIVFKNIIAIKKGLKKDVIVITAHYDTAIGTPGADDNASGVAVTLELARLISTINTHKCIYFEFFTNEEPPFFRTKAMGSYINARNMKIKNVPIEFVINLECIGYYSDKP
ncbi:MAG: M28 family peptidase, partial [bacterium]|nr:M28 family peptidase [bacterium]